MKFTFTETSPNLERNTKILLSGIDNRNRFSRSLKNLTEENKNIIKEEVMSYYFEKGWGLKILARNVLGISYSNCRSLFLFLELEHNKGYNICNDFLKEFRKEKSANERKNNIGWGDPSLKRYTTSTRRGIQGYYFNNSTNSFNWLRSTYEFIYAKFLNKINCNWRTEEKYYTLSDGTKYCPDFFIYNDNWELIKIVEIKGYWDNRAYKTALLKEEYFNDSNVEIILIKDITFFIESDSNYYKELDIWKLIRKSKEQLSQI